GGGRPGRGRRAPGPSGTMTMRVGASAVLDGARTARQVYEAWGSRFLDGKTVRVRVDPVRRDGPELVALVTLDSPPANALGAEVLDDLERAVDALERERHLRAVVLTGAGSMFVAGADIRQLRAVARAEDVAARATRAQRLFARIGRLKAPAISAVDGYALGGGNELQMACAWRVAGARAELGQPEINLHVIPGFGGTQMLPRLAARRGAARRGAGFPPPLRAPGGAAGRPPRGGARAPRGVGRRGGGPGRRVVAGAGRRATDRGGRVWWCALPAARGCGDARVSQRGARCRDRTPACPPHGGSPRGAGRRDRRGRPDGSHAGPRSRPRAGGATVRRAHGERGRARRHRSVL